MTRIDELLAVIENPTRRKILEALVREPHYPLQLSRELKMSQQAIMKHLKVLEAYNLIRSFEEESDLGGPSRKRYFPAVSFTIIVDVGPNLFHAELVPMEGPKGSLPSTRGEKEVEDLPRVAERLRELREHILGLDEELERLQSKRTKLVREKEDALDEVGDLVNQIDDYQLRRIIYEFVSRPELDPEDVARELSLRDELVDKTLKDLLEE